MIPGDISKALAEHFSAKGHSDFQITSSSPLGGGSINEVYCLTTSSGTFCLKYNTSRAFPKMFETEARGLKLLAGSGSIRVPRVICNSSLQEHSFILLEYIRPGTKIKDFNKDFARSLSQLHRNTGELFGLDYNNYMGSLAQNNCYHSEWVDFFVEERLVKQVELAVNKGLLDDSAMKSFERLYLKLDDLLPEEPPCLVHGDLWSGNFIVSEEGKACLIDPATYYGNREVDISMSTLFGGFGQDFYTAYDEEYPLIKGWRERIDLYNLYPLLIHLNLFGTSYLGSVLSILRRF
jgi:protein-ribulosamine 3-kinase